MHSGISFDSATLETVQKLEGSMIMLPTILCYLKSFCIIHRLYHKCYFIFHTFATSCLINTYLYLTIVIWILNLDAYSFIRKLALVDDHIKQIKMKSLHSVTFHNIVLHLFMTKHIVSSSYYNFLLIF